MSCSRVLAELVPVAYEPGKIASKRRRAAGWWAEKKTEAIAVGIDMSHSIVERRKWPMR